jgi:ABC-type dipeptide/oligopeptide/nickel transport system ATPase component
MKLIQNNFKDYINELNTYNIHKKHKKIIDNLPNNIKDFNNLIVYGPSGIGKYSQVLKIISKYSKSELQYEKKIIVNNNKYNFNFKISDIHYEIDMSLLGVNAKNLWHDIYNHILDILSTNRKEYGIILCKNFDKIDNELLDVFYYYMCKSNKVRFVLICENLSFINENIFHFCDILTYNRPCKSDYNKITKLDNNVNTNEITNIQNMKLKIFQLMNPNKIICDKLIKEIKSKENINYNEIRILLYDILIYQLDIGACLWYILNELHKENILSLDKLLKINEKIYQFYKYFNNNYRPIFHLERLVLYISKIVNGL